MLMLVVSKLHLALHVLQQRREMHQLMLVVEQSRLAFRILQLAFTRCIPRFASRVPLMRLRGEFVSICSPHVG